MILTVKRGVILAFLLTFLASCGFHLRGSLPLPEGVKNIVLRAADNRFRDALEEGIRGAGGNISKTVTADSVVLRITHQKTDRTVNTLDTRGKANSYNLTFTVDYELQAPDGKIIRKETLTELRRYNFNPSFVLETESEEDELMENMERTIVVRLMRQLSSLSNYQS